jgi:hypothetical protein
MSSFTRRKFCRTLAAGAVSSGVSYIAGRNIHGDSSRAVKRGKVARVWRTEHPHQTIGFELLQLPGQKFELAVPELISDSKGDILPKGYPSPEWDIKQDLARCSVETRGLVRMEAEIAFSDEHIDIVVTTTNLSNRVWDNVDLFASFAYGDAPLFNDPDLSNTYFPVGGDDWKSVRKLSAQNDLANAPDTLFPVFSDLWVDRRQQQDSPQPVSQGAACVLSKHGNWVIGMTTQKRAYVYRNRRESCIHAIPALGALNPGETVKDVTGIHIFRGSFEDFNSRI